MERILLTGSLAPCPTSTLVHLSLSGIGVTWDASVWELVISALLKPGLGFLSSCFHNLTCSGKFHPATTHTQTSCNFGCACNLRGCADGRQLHRLWVSTTELSAQCSPCALPHRGQLGAGSRAHTNHWGRGAWVCAHHCYLCCPRPQTLQGGGSQCLITRLLKKQAAHPDSTTGLQ